VLLNIEFWNKHAIFKNEHAYVVTYHHVMAVPCLQCLLLATELEINCWWWIIIHTNCW